MDNRQTDNTRQQISAYTIDLFVICLTPYISILHMYDTFAEETFASGKIREIFGRNFREFRELANFGFFARIIFREFML